MEFRMFPSGKTLSERHNCGPDEAALVLWLSLLGQVWWQFCISNKCSTHHNSAQSYYCLQFCSVTFHFREEQCVWGVLRQKDMHYLVHMQCTRINWEASLKSRKLCCKWLIRWAKKPFKLPPLHASVEWNSSCWGEEMMIFDFGKNFCFE